MNNKILRITAYFFYLLIVWGLYRAFFNFHYLWDELFFKPLFWLIPVFWLVFKLERRGFASLGLVFKKPLAKVFLGLGISSFVFIQYLLALASKGRTFVFNPSGIKPFIWPLAFLSCVATGIVEELAFRGFLMTRLNEVIKRKLWSSVIVGFLFFIIHLPILIFIQGFGLAGIAEFLVLSVSLGTLDGYVFWKTKGVLAPIVAHSSLNFFSLLVS